MWKTWYGPLPHIILFNSKSYIQKIENSDTLKDACVLETCTVCIHSVFTVFTVETREIHWDSLFLEDLQLSLKGGIIIILETRCPFLKESSHGYDCCYACEQGYLSPVAVMNSAPSPPTEHQKIICISTV